MSSCTSQGPGLLKVPVDQRLLLSVAGPGAVYGAWWRKPGSAIRWAPQLLCPLREWVIILETAYFRNYPVFNILILFSPCSTYSSDYKCVDLETHTILSTSLYKYMNACLPVASEKNQLHLGRSGLVGRTLTATLQGLLRNRTDCPSWGKAEGAADTPHGEWPGPGEDGGAAAG